MKVHTSLKIKEKNIINNINNFSYNKINKQTLNNKMLGFWAYIMSDLIIFSTLFATYFVLKNNNHYGPIYSEIFNLPIVFIETIVLLISSLTCSIALIHSNFNKIKQIIIWLSQTLLFGLFFIILEIHELYYLIAIGYSYTYNAFLSALFTILATHCAHIIVGLIWIIIIIIQLINNGLNDINYTRLQCLGLFWHFLDIIWIFIFTMIYLLGVC